jgi:hypothetical protein
MTRYIIAMVLSTTLIFGSSKVAIAIKVKGNVSVIYKGLNSPQVLKPGSPLSDQDRIKTGKNGFKTCGELSPLYITETLPLTFIAIATFEDPKIKVVDNTMAIIYLVILIPQHL